MQIFVISYADAVALPGLYADEAALIRTRDEEYHALFLDAAKAARETPGEPVDLGDGDQLAYLTVTEANAHG